MLGKCELSKGIAEWVAAIELSQLPMNIMSRLVIATRSPGPLTPTSTIHETSGCYCASKALRFYLTDFRIRTYQLLAPTSAKDATAPSCVYFVASAIAFNETRFFEQIWIRKAIQVT